MEFGLEIRRQEDDMNGVRTSGWPLSSIVLNKASPVNGLGYRKGFRLNPWCHGF